MLTYVIIGLWIYSSHGSPIQQQNLKGGPLVYYTPTSQYLQGNLYHPFVPYPQESPAFGKALQSLQSQNEILFYPNPAVVQQQPVLINTQHGNVPLTRFTAPPKELVGAVYAWFAENNIPIPEDPNRSGIYPEKLGSKEQGKPDSSEKTAGEADVLAEADKNPNFHFPKKPVSPKFNPGQRFYILNGQPQFVSNYQPPLPRVQPYIPQLLTRNSIPAEPQNIFFLQSQPELQQQNLNLKTQQVQEQTNQNVVLVENPIQSDIKPIRYHNTELKPQNYVLLRENQQQENTGAQIQVQPLVPTYSRQQLLIGRLLPQTQDIKQQQIQTPIHQTHYVPVEVVPPQVPQFQPQQLYQNQDLPEQETNPQPHLAFIHIPVDRNVQPPQYITAKTTIPGLQQPSSAKQLLYLSSEPQVSQVAQQRVGQADHQFQQQAIPNTQSDASDNLAPGIAALEFARYIASKQGDLYSDSVVVDVKTEEDKREEDNESEVVQADNSEEPSIAQAQPGGIALAGPGGVAATAPRGTALVGEKGLAVASPHATAVAGPTPSKNKENRS